jgi:hypothetical protein
MFSATLSPSDVDELPLSDNPGDLLVVGPAARIIGRQGSRRVILLQPALLGETIIVPLVIELGADDRPIPEQDGHQLGIRPSLTALEEVPVPLLPDGWTTGGGYRSLACVACFRAAGHARASLRLDMTVPLLEQPVSYVFTFDQ